MNIYLSGAMASCMDTYKEDFNAAEAELVKQGHIVINPSTLPIGLDPTRYMPMCLAMIDGADVVCMIDNGWQTSKGALLEKMYAEYQGKEVWYLK